MAKYDGRNTVACFSCHSWKVKCSGGTPCQRCRTRNRQCSYPLRDRVLAIPESYLRGLEMDALDRRAVEGYGTETMANAMPSSQGGHSPMGVTEPSSLLDDCSAEHFVQRLKEVSFQMPARDQATSSPTLTRYTYSRLSFDFIHPEVSFKLPPRPYAFHLLQGFEEGFSDYHWYLRKRFRQRLSLTYSNPSSQAKERNWLCIVSVVLALAESWNHSRSTSPFATQNRAGPEFGSPPVCDEGTSPQPPPGFELFEQALLLLRMSLEEPAVEYVQALNLIAFYCYSLNRRKTAYFYSGQSIRLAKLLRLDETSQPGVAGSHKSDTGNLENEHRKRIWWTSYCMDQMISTELGLTSWVDDAADPTQLPSSYGLSPAEIEEFFNPDLLAAQVQLCSIKSKIVRTVTHHSHTRFPLHPLNVIQPCLDLLQRWRTRVPQYMSFTFEGGIPATMMDLPFARVLASLYLRYHQCFILLLRPLFLQALSSRYGQQHHNHGIGLDADMISLHKDYHIMAAMKLRCLQAARCNARILRDLAKVGKIAKFGYWESLHLFSALAILSLSQVVIGFGETEVTPEDRSSMALGPSPPFSTRDSELYAQARALLDEMASAGSLASKDHVELLCEIEEMVEKAQNSRAGHDMPPQECSQAGGAGDMFEGVLDEQVWQDMDWEGFLRSWVDGTVQDV